MGNTEKIETLIDRKKNGITQTPTFKIEKCKESGQLDRKGAVSCGMFKLPSAQITSPSVSKLRLL
jgi:hypothetical protein